MRKKSNQLVYSPSDLITFMESSFDSWMERFYLEFPDEVQPDERDESAEILAKHGNTHELAFLQQLRKEGYDIAEIHSKDESALLETIQAMRDGRKIIYQGFLQAGEFAGLSDFLVKVDGKSQLGDFHYEVWDTKLSKKAKPYFLVQLSCYAEMLELIQGRLPGAVRVVLGDLSQKEFRTSEYFYIYRELKKRFLEFQRCFSKDDPPENRTAGSFSRWTAVSEKFLEDRDHLSRVANIRKSQIHRLTEAGITTLTQLAESDKQSIPNLSRDIFEILKKQAKLQNQSKAEGKTVYEVLRSPGKGLSLMPPASFNDVYFDMEGYPLMEGGLEYLFGAVYDEDGAVEFKDWWAHDRAKEKEAFEQFIDWVYARWRSDPYMHIYHYAAYEVSACRRLAGRHATRVEEVDNLLRHGVFVDLFHVVRQGLRVGEPSYSIKYVEHLYRDKRSGTVSKATDSVVFYERWIESEGSHDWQENSILKEIRDYNEEDCVSTRQLAYWLRDRQVEHGIPFAGEPAVAPPPVQQILTTAGELANDLMSDAEFIEDPETKRVQQLLAGLLEFHKREDKPMWWRMFERKNASTEELYYDLDCLSGLTWTRKPPIKVRRSLGYEYTFDPDQDTKLDEGSSCLFAHNLERTRIHEIDRKSGRVIIVLGASKEVPPEEISLIVDEFVDSKVISDSILRVCQGWALKKILPRCLHDLFFRKAPNLLGHQEGAPVSPSCDVHDISHCVSSMQNTCLSIQGPPGTGKTFTASHTIADLLRQGKRVGITSNSHKAIDNLLEKVVEVARREGVPVNAAKVGSTDANSGRTIPGVRMFKGSNKFFADGDLNQFNVVAGTAWLFSHEFSTKLVDYLFVDEAGQVSLANVAAVSPSTSNLVLLGDQMQLEQPTQGSHPGESGQSCLDYLLQERATIPDTMGIFLDTTRRMHPDITEVISSAVYDSRLLAHEENSKQLLIPPGQVTTGFSKRSGVVWVPVEHSGNAQASEEEVDAIEDLINVLLKCCVSDKNGSINVVTMRDILIVTPYNMQVRKIASRIPGARVASVDKFQGQEAPIVILSMCASEGSSSPRGLDFLFSRSRLNVAISRAKTLAFVVGSPELLNTPCTSLKQMKLMSFFCQIVDAGKGEFELGCDKADFQKSA